MKKRQFIIMIIGVIVSIIVGFSGSGLAASKDTLTIAMWTRISSLDPWNSVMLADWIISEQIQDCLYIVDLETRRPVPNLALGHKLINDTTWEFDLKKGVKFSNGEPFNAESVKYTIDRILDKKRNLINFAIWDKVIDRVEIVDDHKIRIITKKPYPIMLEKLAFSAFMLPPKYSEEKGDAYLGEHPIGTGPYKLVNWKRGEEINLMVNENYRGKPPAIKKVKFRIIPEAAVSTAELITGGVDVVGRIGVDQVKTIEKAKRAMVFKSESNRNHFLMLDVDGRASETPMQKLKVRQAVFHAINRKEIIDNVKQGYGVMLHGPLYHNYNYFDPTVKDLEPEYNPEKAKQLLAEAGYPNGFEAQLSSYLEKEVYEAVLGYLAKVGIKAKLNWYGGDISTLVKLRNSGKVKDMGAYSWGTNIYDPDYFLPGWLALDAARNYSKDKELDAWLAEAGQTFDKEKRKDLYSKIQHRVIERVYWVPIYGEISLYGVSTDLNFVACGEYPRYYLCSWK